jgi:uncharacterized LabA/DUF88 family protein
MLRANFYIDGFNLYHSPMEDRETAACRWLDLRSLAEAIVAKDDILDRVLYFSALTRNQEKALRHRTFIRALKTRRVEFIEGRFASVTRTCRATCKEKYEAYEEKETDVNISSRMIADAATDRVDVLYLMTGDSDQVPTVRAIRNLAPSKQVVAVFPVRRHSNDLKQVAYRTVKLTSSHYLKNQLPSPITLLSGAQIHCPAHWLPPKDGPWGR